MHNYKNNLILLLVAIIWGGAFIAQSSSMNYIGPWTFTCIRSFLAGFAILLSFQLIKKSILISNSYDKKATIIGGICCGLIVTPANILQQIGIQYTTVGKAGFITALYCIIVPFLSILLKKKVSIQTWIAATISLIGFYFLSVSESFTLSTGDSLMLLSAFFFAVQILAIDYFVTHANGILMSSIQFIIVGCLTLIPAVTLEQTSLFYLQKAFGAILYAGLLSNGVGSTLQIVGQKGADPTVATLILSLESVFSAIGGYLFLHEVLSLRELFGCVLVFCGVILAQIKLSKK